MLTRVLLTGLLLISAVSAVRADSGPEQLKRFLDGLETFRAGFEQTVQDEEQERSDRFRGTLSLQRPGRFRWDYTEPYAQLILADGKRVWIYDADLEQVSSRSQGEVLSGTPAQLLSDASPIDENFEVNGLGEEQGVSRVELIPLHDESQFARILLAFQNGNLQQMEMADKFGQITLFRFFDAERNPKLAEDTFIFVPPEGVDLLVQ